MDPDLRNVQRSAEPVVARFALDALSAQGRVRADIRHLLIDAGCRESLVDDVLVVVSELWSNATEHGGAVEIATEISVVPGGIVTSVSYESPSTLDGIPAGRMPPVHAARGRGLALVDALTDSCRHEVDGSSVSTTCRFSSP